jgi:excisionase family DNA binding protein
MELATDESDPRAFRIREVCKRTGLGRTTIYAAIKDGSLKAKKYRRTTNVMASDLRAWLMTLPSAR